MFKELGVRVHVISGSPLVVLRAYSTKYPIVERVSGISKTGRGNLLDVKRQATKPYRSDSPAQFAVGDSESDLPLFAVARYSVGVNLDDANVLGPERISIRADGALRMSERAQLQTQFIFTHPFG